MKRRSYSSAAASPAWRQPHRISNAGQRDGQARDLKLIEASEGSAAFPQTRCEMVS